MESDFGFRAGLEGLLGVEATLYGWVDWIPYPYVITNAVRVIAGLRHAEIWVDPAPLGGVVMTPFYWLIPPAHPRWPYGLHLTVNRP